MQLTSKSKSQININKHMQNIDLLLKDGIIHKHEHTYLIQRLNEKTLSK